MTAVRLFFPHIPKTGGTSLLYHFRRQMGDDRILILGPHARAQRFFGRQPQFEEMSDEELAPIRVVQWHGVDEGAVPALAGGDARLLVVLRHPLGLTRSRYNHLYNTMQARNITLTTTDFRHRDPGDVMCRLIISHFPSFVDPAAGEGLAAQAMSALRAFDYVLTTENMDRQVVPLSLALGLDPSLERRRVAESRQVLEETDEEILARNTADLQLFERCNTVLETDGRSHNPLGHDPEIAQRALGRIEVPPRGSAARQRACYELLARALAGSNQLAAALDWMGEDSGPRPRIDNPDLLQDVLQQVWLEVQPKLSPGNAVHSEQQTAVQRKRRARQARSGG